ncbi:sorting nexin-33-like [Haematobia irritans]|uniref:sorting nexin-33-like n=1 Tax=Haematobia irritans TaxID=7368 RepID=UPI003F501349
MTSHVRALYEFSGEPGTSEISIAVGDILEVIRTDVGEGWWEGKNSRGDVGLFPAAYVEVMPMGINDIKQRQHIQVSQNAVAFESNTNASRYDSMTDDFNDGDDWEDDWDDDTYSEIGPSNNSSKTNEKHIQHSSSNYDKNLPPTPSEDVLQSTFLPGNNNTATLKKSGMFGKSSDSFILGLGNKDKLPENELIHIVPCENFYQWQPNYQSYSVVVASPKKETKFKGMKTFIAYQLTPSFNNISPLKFSRDNVHSSKKL